MQDIWQKKKPASELFQSFHATEHWWDCGTLEFILNNKKLYFLAKHLNEMGFHERVKWQGPNVNAANAPRNQQDKHWIGTTCRVVRSVPASQQSHAHLLFPRQQPHWGDGEGVLCCHGDARGSNKCDLEDDTRTGGTSTAMLHGSGRPIQSPASSEHEIHTKGFTVTVRGNWTGRQNPSAPTPSCAFYKFPKPAFYCILFCCISGERLMKTSCWGQSCCSVPSPWHNSQGLNNSMSMVITFKLCSLACSWKWKLQEKVSSDMSLKSQDTWFKQSLHSFDS